MRVITSGSKQIDFENAKAVCREDYATHHNLETHLAEEHDMSVADYQRRYGKNATVFGGRVFKEFFDREIERKGSRSYHTYVAVGNIKMRAQVGMMSQRPSRPNGYMYPEKGAAGKAAQRVARAVKYGRNIFLYGPAGTGKSDMFRCLAHDLNMEFSLYPMREDLDTALYMGQMQVVIDPETKVNKTQFVEGRLLKDIQGRIGKDGIRRAVMITIDDIDRAPSECHELFRHILDGAKEVFIPELGKSIPVFPGTTIVATANSRGRGDDFGFYSSVESMDDSILDRFGRFIEYHYLEVEEEKKILKAKFPYLKKVAPQAFDTIMDVTKTIRHMITNREIHIGFSHRILTEWATCLEELIQENDERFDKVLVGKAAYDWLERFDEDTRKALFDRTLRAYIPHGDRDNFK